MMLNARHTGSAVLALFAALTLGACNSSGGDTGTSPTGPATPTTASSSTSTSPSSPTPTSSAPVPVSAFAGGWKGTFQSSRRTTSHGTISATFTQTGSTLGGRITISVPCAPKGTITGTVRGKTVAFGVIHSAATPISFTGAVQGHKLSGSYRTGAACAYDRGHWSATRS